MVLSFSPSAPIQSPSALKGQSKTRTRLQLLSNWQVTINEHAGGGKLGPAACCPSLWEKGGPGSEGAPPAPSSSPNLAQQPESSPVLQSLLPDYFVSDSDLSIAKNSDQTPLEFGRLVVPES